MGSRVTNNDTAGNVGRDIEVPAIGQEEKPQCHNGHGEARLIALACSEPPPGRCDWTLRLLADKLVELQIVESIATETVRQVLKKTNSSRG